MIAQNLNIQPIKILPAQKKRIYRDTKTHLRTNSKNLSSLPTGGGNTDLVEEILMLGTENIQSGIISTQRTNYNEN